MNLEGRCWLSDPVHDRHIELAAGESRCLSTRWQEASGLVWVASGGEWKAFSLAAFLDGRPAPAASLAPVYRLDAAQLGWSPTAIVPLEEAGVLALRTVDRGRATEYTHLELASQSASQATSGRLLLLPQTSRSGLDGGPQVGGGLLVPAGMSVAGLTKRAPGAHLVASPDGRRILAFGVTLPGRVFTAVS